MTVENETGVATSQGPVDPAAGEADLGRRIAAGEAAALDQCYRTMGYAVRSYATRFVAAEDADDVVQRVFYEVWRSCRSYDPARSLRGWLFGITRKRAIDHLRLRTRRSVSLDGVADVAGEDGREWLDRLTVRWEIQRALALLPAAQRAVIELAYFQCCTQPEIAMLLDIPLGTVKTRTSRGLVRLAVLVESGRRNPTL